MEPAQANFEGWAVVEMMGHQREIGYVTTQAFGQAVLFRIDTPELPEREYILESPEYVGMRLAPKGTKVPRKGTPAKSRLVSPGALYAINPCTEEAARAALERLTARPLIVLELPEGRALEPAPGRPSEYEDDFDHEGEDE